MAGLFSVLIFIIYFTAGMLQPATATAASAKDNLPLGRQAVAIVDGQYPASYFPNTELLGPGEMRITALGTGGASLRVKRQL